jgi:16S rRNA processing protein RimM
VGRAHGLDGSFYVTGVRSRLLEIGTIVAVAGSSAPVVRLAGTEEHPIVRLQGIEERAQAEAIRGQELTVALEQVPALGEGEWWASELEGCEVVDGERHVGVVARLVELPSCEALEVRLAISEGDNEDESAGGAVGGRGHELLVPMVRDAIRQVDVARQRIDIDMSFLADT